jgi:hypothetical protein
MACDESLADGTAREFSRICGEVVADPIGEEPTNPGIG